MQERIDCLENTDERPTTYSSALLAVIIRLRGAALCSEPPNLTVVFEPNLARPRNRASDRFCPEYFLP
jgi:hypothetical protein